MRSGSIERKTAETEISLAIELDGTGEAIIATTIPFLDHMLTLFTKHGLFNLRVTAQGDREIDDHHLVEDVGICLGEALRKAIGDKAGIERYGAAMLPMDESLVSIALDLSGRSGLVFNATLGGQRIGDFDVSLIKEFFKAFTDQGRLSLHINVLYGESNHHMVEAMFKGVGRALRQAVTLHERIQGPMTTKGVL